jgi:riboflavin biosynthesis pyrimidine reductase
MPVELAGRLGGELRIPLRADRPTFVANFVSTLDGVVALGSGELSGGGLISGFHEPDRFVMALLRAAADIVLVGAGTLRESTNQRWIPDHLEPALGPAFREWRRTMGLAPRPTTVIVSGSGEVPVRHPALVDPAIPVVVGTSPGGVARLHERGLAPHVAVESIGTGEHLSGDDVLGLVSCLGGRLVLSEGGPRLLGELVKADLLDELFLTVAPQLVGRDGPRRPGLVEGVALPPGGAPWHDLVSVRRSANHLFLRYRRVAERSVRQES